MRKKLKAKPQLSRLERERRTLRILVVVILVAVVVVLGLIGYGYYDTRIKPWHQPIVKVNDSVFDMRYYVKMLRLWGAGQNPSQDVGLAQYAADVIRDNELIRQEAERRGLYPLDATEVENRLKKQFGFDSGNQTEKQFYTQLETNLASYHLTLDALREMYVEPIILQEKLLAAMGNETYPQVQVQAMLLGTEEEARQVMVEWNAGGNFTQLAANTAYSISHVYDNSWLPQGIESSVFDGFAFSDNSTGAVISEPVRDTTYLTAGGYWIIEVLEPMSTTNETWHIGAILLDSSETAAEVRNAITSGSGNFTQLAKDNSLDTTSKASGGDLGWLTSANITSKFGAGNLGTIQALEPNMPSEPIYSATVSKKSGYWLIKVLEKQDRILSEEHRSTVISNAYDKWLEGERTGEGVKNYLDPGGKKIIWALDHV